MSPDEPGQPSPSRTAVAPQRRRGRFFWLAVGLIVGLLAGLGLGYALFNGKKVTIQGVPAAATSPTASPSATALPTPTPTAPPVATAAPVAQGVAACPVATPLGQHQLGTPGPPGQGQTQSAGLKFCGAGNATIPTGTTRFLTSGGWGLGIADSCPVGSSGQGGMGTVLTVGEVIPGGGRGPDTATEPGDWVDGGSQLMATGGSFQLQVTTVSPSCVWQVNIYPS